MLENKNYNILFISLVIIKNLEKRGIYPDLIKYFISQGHHVTILSPVERREKNSSEIIEGEGYTNIRYKTLNNTKTNYVEKLVSTFVIDFLLKRAIKNHVRGPIDIAVYATPPITMTRTIEFIKRKFKVPCYLLLKDIFPDNIADLGLLSKNSFLYAYFRKKEKYLYTLSDYIGCMSPANVRYLLENNPELISEKVEVNPNTIDPIKPVKDIELIQNLKNKYKINSNAKVFFYGGNLGKPQMIGFLIEVLQSNLENDKVHFLIVGTGTEYGKIEKWLTKNQPQNVTLLSFVPKSEYDILINVGDVGLLLLDNRFKIPNFPNRILSYMENYMPVLSATDVHTDIGKIAQENGFGYWCHSGDVEAMNTLIQKFVQMDTKDFIQIGKTGNQFLKENYLIEKTYRLIVDKVDHFDK
ncbi:MAG: glycosyltransferase family 4 protein [Saprospiraceae bacterium]